MMRKHAEKAGANPAPAMKERVGIFMKEWKIVTSYGPSSMNSHITSFRAGQIIFNESKIDELVSQGAPLRIYSRDVE